MNLPLTTLISHISVVCVAAALLAGSLSNVCQAQQRTWTDSTGSYKIEAELVDVSESKDGLMAQLLMADGKRMAIQVSKLCDADQFRAQKFFEESQKKVDTPEEKPDPPVAVKTPKSDEQSEVKRLLPEENIVSRPIGAPLNMASGKLDNRKITKVNFDPDTAIRLDREIVRDEKGRPLENPAYFVEVTDRELSFVPRNLQKLVSQLNDARVAVDVKRRAISALKDNWPQGRYPGLLNVLINTLSHEDKYLRLAAIDLLANHDSDQSLAYIFARIDDVSFDVRWRAYEILTQLRDPRIIPELCERLDGADRTKVSSVLQAFGSTSIPWVHPWIEDGKDEKVLLNACQLLGKIGDSESLDKLRKLETHESFLVRAQTENSIRQIEDRLEERASKSPKLR